MSSSAPFATVDSATSGDAHTGGRRKYEAQSQKHDAPFATNYPEQRDDGNTPKKHVGRRRYEQQDAAHEAPFATASGEPMFQSPPAAAAPAPANATPAAGQTGRQQAIKPSDNSDVFRYDGKAADDTPTRGGRRRFDQQSKQSDAPFATFGGSDERNGTESGRTETPRSAGGRRRFEDKLAKQPAPFALDDGQRFKDSPARSKGTAANNDSHVAGARKKDRNVPPPNSLGEGQENRSQMRDCPFALN